MFAFLFLVLSAAFADELKARCTRVLDGDTIEVTVEGQEIPTKIRLAQIDAPEKKQDYGVIAKVNLANLVLNQEIEVEYKKKDRYGRIIGQVYMDMLIEGSTERVDINLAQVSAGLAWVYVAYPHTQLYLTEEAFARKAERGLWKDPSAIPPWLFRKMQ